MFTHCRSRRITAAIAVWIALAVSVAGHAQNEADLDAGEAARRRVEAFERPLAKQMLDSAAEGDAAIADARELAVRRFFAGLSDSETKLAAMDMLDRRYVYLVPQAVAVELLGPLIRDDDPRVKSRAAAALGYNNGGRVYPAELIAMLENDPPAETIANVAVAMGRSAHLPFAAHLERLLEHDDGSVRSTALVHLTMLANAALLEHHRRALEDRDAMVRMAAVQNLTRFPGQPSIEMLHSRLDDESDRVRERAVWTLGQMHSRSSAGAIAERLTDPHPHVRGRAALVLGDLQAVDFADAVAARLDDDNLVVRRYAVQALGAMGEPRFTARLEHLTNDPDEQIRKYAAEAIQSLTSGTRESE